MNERIEELMSIICEGQNSIQREEVENYINNLQSKIDKAIEYYETHQQECVIGRNKDDKLIKDYYLPAQCSKKLYEFLKEDK